MRAPRPAQCNLFPVQHDWARPYLICPRHPTHPALLEPAVPEVQDLSPSPNEASESSAILKFVTELPTAQNNSPFCGPQSTAWYELQIQEEEGGAWVSQDKNIRSSVVRKKHLKAGKVYRFRVRIVHNGTPSGWSEESAPLKHGHIVGKDSATANAQPAAPQQTGPSAPPTAHPGVLLAHAHPIPQPRHAPSAQNPPR